MLAGVRGSIDFAFGAEYLLAPIAAVVIAGASLAGGLASVTSTWVAALALTLLNQVLLVLGLSPAMQYVVFGAAILAGMIVSGDRIAAVLGKVLQHPRARALFGGDRRSSSTRGGILRRRQHRDDAWSSQTHNAPALEGPDISGPYEAGTS